MRAHLNKVSRQMKDDGKVGEARSQQGPYTRYWEAIRSQASEKGQECWGTVPVKRANSNHFT